MAPWWNHGVIRWASPVGSFSANSTACRVCCIPSRYPCRLELARARAERAEPIAVASAAGFAESHRSVRGTHGLGVEGGQTGECLFGNDARLSDGVTSLRGRPACLIDGLGRPIGQDQHSHPDPPELGASLGVAVSVDRSDQ